MLYKKWKSIANHRHMSFLPRESWHIADAQKIFVEGMKESNCKMVTMKVFQRVLQK